MDAEKSRFGESSFLDIEWSVKDGKINTSAKKNNTLSIRNLSGSVTVNGEMLLLKDAKINSCKEGTGSDGKRTCVLEFIFEGHGIGWGWEIIGNDKRIEVTAILKNVSNRNNWVAD